MCLAALAQDSPSPSLGDVARQSRKEHLAPGHVAGKTLVNDEEDGPDSTGVWRVRSCVLTNACYEVSITLPKTPKWTRLTSEPRPVLIPLNDREAGLDHAIRIYSAEGVGPKSTLDIARRMFLQSWFARPEYFGQSARLVLDEHTSMNSTSLVITHFTIGNSAPKYRGASVLAAAYDDNHGFACVFRDEDTSTAGSICDAIIKSAQSQMLLQPPKRRVYPSHRTPPQYYPEDDPPEDPPDDNDP